MSLLVRETQGDHSVCIDSRLGEALVGHGRRRSSTSCRLGRKTNYYPPDLVLMEQAPKFGNPPVLLADMRPKEPPLLFIFNGDVAEQLTKPTKQFPTSIPKTPGMKNLSPLVGERSLVNLDVSQSSGTRARCSVMASRPGLGPGLQLSNNPPHDRAKSGKASGRE